MAQLREQPHDFDLFQAISLLERAEPDRAAVGTSVGLDEALRLTAQVSHSFAPSDIGALHDSRQPGPPLTLASPVLSLAGPGGPLPTPLSELLLERRRLRDTSGLEFLDIFNQRLLAFLYRSRRKHHLALSAAASDHAPLVRCLDAMASLGRAEGVRGPHGEQVWLRHAGVQGAAPRSMMTLLAVVRDRLGVRFGGKQFVGGWHTLAPDDRARLYSPGSSAPPQAGLGMGMALGARAWDQCAGLALDAPPLQPAQFAALLPGGKDNAMLTWLVGRHLQSAMQVELKLDLATKPATRLGDRSPVAPRLGLSAWLCSPAGEGASRENATAYAVNQAAAQGAGAHPGAAASHTPGSGGVRRAAHYRQPRFLLAIDAPEGN
ncbi:type VI secretion system baseplate subunit TssG [Duganella ginsengisoli]|uniref:Type VI secretion system baseplate subunit TssG n=1 Tax=Pseudoduganella ginsengisoli TaxID=1462440 RepID=A0A6L6Q291_9BURK|nr:type VI secretion system baseplate subunit TssG [Pseudoduganella ginsengisoli]